jgi:survival-of-motor-neuron-related-splicing factor 30
MDQLLEYETQLADVEALLQDSPDDPSLLSLKSDLVELLTITKESIPTEASESAVGESAALPEASLDTTADSSDAWSDPTGFVPADASSTAIASKWASDGPTDTEAAVAEEPPKKKAKKLKDFEVPEHLIPLDTDTDPEKNRKRRAIKALKNKWRERKKEVESDKKQKSWQSFQKKKVNTKDKSMFSTQDGDAKVGVVSVSGRQLTEFGERKRHQS